MVLEWQCSSSGKKSINKQGSSETQNSSDAKNEASFLFRTILDIDESRGESRFEGSATFD